MKGQLSCTVSHSAEDVFDFLADIRNERAWNPRVIRIDKTSGGQVGAGSKFQGHYRGLGRLDTELVEYEPPHRLGFRSEGPRMRIVGTFVLSRTRDGTQVDLAAELEPRGVFRFLTPLMTPIIRKQNEAAAVRLARALSRER